jgi:hypothetical protein
MGPIISNWVSGQQDIYALKMQLGPYGLPLLKTKKAINTNTVV